MPDLGEVMSNNEPQYKSRIPAWAWLVFIIIAIAGLTYKTSQKYAEFHSKNAVTSTVPLPKPVSNFKVLESKQFYLRIVNEKNQIELRTGGNITWRTNNPAKIMWGQFASEHGALEPGDNQTVAVFPNEELGQRANYILLFESKAYSHLPLSDAIKKYAPVSEGYMPDRYLDFLKKETNINQDKVLRTLTEEERQSILQAIKKYEGWLEGKVTIFRDINEWETSGW